MFDIDRRKCFGVLLTLLLPAASCADTGGDVAETAAPLPAERAGEVTGGADSPPSTAGGSDTMPADDEPSAAEWTAALVQRDHEVTGAPILSDVRIGRNQGFDRVVLEFDEDEIPSYRIEYVDRPVVQCGSGDPVPLRGDAWLLIRLEPARAHNEAGRPTIQEREGEPDLPVLLQHRIVCDFEGHVDWVLAVSTPNRFRVMELAEPARLVVDIRH